VPTLAALNKALSKLACAPGCCCPIDAGAQNPHPMQAFAAGQNKNPTVCTHILVLEVFSCFVFFNSVKKLYYVKS